MQKQIQTSQKDHLISSMEKEMLEKLKEESKKTVNEALEKVKSLQGMIHESVMITSNFENVILPNINGKNGNHILDSLEQKIKPSVNTSDVQNHYNAIAATSALIGLLLLRKKKKEEE